ncbi:MAG: DUF456 domain-containing protein [Dermatophilaceae bacterium]
MNGISDELWSVLPALLIVVGLVGIVVPLLPGMLVILAGVLVFAAVEGTTTGWLVFGASVVVAGAGWVLQYLVPGRRMRERGVSTPTLLLAVLLGVVGFFVIPVVGAIVGFVAGIYAVELVRGGDTGQAWTRTKHAAVAVAQSMGIELAAGFVIAGLYVTGVILT